MSGAQRDSEEPSAAADVERPQESEPGGNGAGQIVVRCAGRTAVGQVRDHNEDNFVVANLGTGQIRPRDLVCEELVKERGLIFAVCDGMGGAAAGEVASQMAVDILVEAMRRGGVPKNRDVLARRLVGAVEEAGRRIFDAAQKERSRRGMGTTATVAVLVDKVMFLAEVGDSRAYLLRQNQLKQLTKDQSLVNQLIEAGHLTEDEAEAFEHSNIILQALGTSETVQVDLTFVELRRGDRLLMCSDGLSGLVHADALRTTLEAVKDPAECTAKLIEYAETAGGHDNITVIVVDFDGEGLAEGFEGDSFGYVQYPLPLPEDESSAFVDEDTTGPGEKARRAASAEDNNEEIAEQDEDESLLPLSSDDGDPRANLIWVVGGVLALVCAGIVWFALEPAASEDSQAHSVVPSPVHNASEPTVPNLEQQHAGAAAAQGAEEVAVNVHTDVEKATLLVNGESKGELSPEQSRSLKLRPGAYRFEAQSAGNPVAFTVVTVRGDTPMDVFLELPKGASENTAGAQGTEATPSQTEHSQKPRTRIATEHPRETPKPSQSASPVKTTENAPAAHGPETASPPGTRKPQTGASSSGHAGAQNSASSQPPVAPGKPRSAEPTAQRAAPTAPTPAQKPQTIPDNPF